MIRYYITILCHNVLNCKLNRTSNFYFFRLLVFSEFSAILFAFFPYHIYIVDTGPKDSNNLKYLSILSLSSLFFCCAYYILFKIRKLPSSIYWIIMLYRYYKTTYFISVIFIIYQNNGTTIYRTLYDFFVFYIKKYWNCLYHISIMFYTN